MLQAQHYIYVCIIEEKPLFLCSDGDTKNHCSGMLTGWKSTSGTLNLSGPTCIKVPSGSCTSATAIQQPKPFIYVQVTELQASFINLAGGGSKALLRSRELCQVDSWTDWTAVCFHLLDPLEATTFLTCSKMAWLDLTWRIAKNDKKGTYFLV